MKAAQYASRFTSLTVDPYLKGKIGRMNSRWFNIAVVLLWLSAMCWLVTKKILPTLLVGEPPAYSISLLEQREAPPVGWTMWWNDHLLGRALTTTEAGTNGTTEMHNRLRFDHVPLGEIVPPFLKNLLDPAGSLPKELAMKVDSHLVFDRKGCMTGFRSSLRFEGDVEAINVLGTVDEGYLILSVGYGNAKEYETDMLLPRDVVLGDGLSPQPSMPGLRDGQTWTTEVFSPLQPPNDPVKIMQATVEGTETVVWKGQTVDTWLVVYRTDLGTGPDGKGEPRGWVWVRPDGIVLKQQVMLFASRLVFVRMADDKAAALAEDIAEELAPRTFPQGGEATLDHDK